MEYRKILDQFQAHASSPGIETFLRAIQPQVEQNLRREVLCRCFASIDLTSLGSADSPQQIEQLTEKVVSLPNRFPDTGSVASVCVYPSLVESVGVAAGYSNLSITSVAGGFPSSQTFLEVKMLEMAMAVENGADEIDIVLPVGEFLSGNFNAVGNEIETLKGELDEEIVLKVIIESGVLQTPERIHQASILAMAAGADFIKTSTGKEGVAATPEAAVVMCEAIRAYRAATGRCVGFKAAGGIVTPEDAVLYYTIVEQILGEEWLTPKRFRIGASRLANHLLSAIHGSEIHYF